MTKKAANVDLPHISALLLLLNTLSETAVVETAVVVIY